MKRFLPPLLMAIVVVGCTKKGEDDPLLSLKTRNARITGTWELVEANFSRYSKTEYLSDTGPDQVSESTVTETYEGKTFSSVREDVDTYDGVTVRTITTYTEEQTFSLTLNKDGTYLMKAELKPLKRIAETEDTTITTDYTDNVDTYEQTGHWWWEDSKHKKTVLVLDDDWDAPMIKRLTNKELVLHLPLSNNNSSTYENGSSS